MEPVQSVDNMQTCVICCENIEESGEKKRTLDCSHVFHDRCIGQWLALKHSCPQCRARVEGITTPEESIAPDTPIASIFELYPFFSRRFMLFHEMLPLLLALESLSNGYENFENREVFHIHVVVAQPGSTEERVSGLARSILR